MVEDDVMKTEQAYADPAEAERRARLTAARAKVEARRAVETSRVSEEELEKAEREARDVEVIEELEAKHGPANKDWRPVYTPEGVVAVKRAHPAYYKRFQELEKTKTEDVEKLVMPALLYPDTSRFDAIVEKHPHVLMQCANAVCWLAGVRKELEQGK